MNRTILVTGVSRGLGLAVAETLLEAGDTVLGVSRTKSEAIGSLEQRFPERMKFRAVDLTSPEAACASIGDDFAGLSVPLHGFVNNAAHAYDDLVTNLQLAPLEEMFAVNVFTPMLLTRHVLRNMVLHRTAGSIVHVSSISAHTGYKGLAMYAATKGALEAFSKNTAREWGERKIRSNCVVAGFMDTAMSGSLTADQKERIHRRTSLKEATQPESVASTIAFLLSDAAASITGQEIFVDAGTI